MQILLQVTGRRVNFKQKEGLFRKIASRSGIFESGPLDLDLRVRKRWVMDLIVGVRLRLGGQGGSGARDAAAPSPELCSAAEGRRG